jgi:hypothetical protein
MWLYILILTNALLLCACGGFVFLLNRAGNTLTEYEDFHLRTIENVEKHISFLNRMINSNIAYEGDESVQRVFKSMKSFYDLLLDYYNAAKRIAPQQKS